jgi:methylthioribose-1-phosphate isomerase
VGTMEGTYQGQRLTAWFLWKEGVPVVTVTIV